MSSYLTPAIYSKNALENQWVNTIYNTHDLCCGCNDAIKHLAAILSRKGSQLCLPSTSTADAGVQATDGGEEDILEDGDLDRLFAEDFDDADG